jgi:hypothetical protein
VLVAAAVVAFAMAAAIAWWISRPEEVAEADDDVVALDDVEIVAPTSSLPSTPADPVAPPTAPTGVALVFTGQGRATLSWSDNSASEAGYVVGVAQFPVGVDGTISATPRREGWIGATGLTETDAAESQPLAADTTSLDVVVEDLAEVTCFRPVALSSSGDAVVGEQLCAPVTPPTAPTVAYAEIVDRPSGTANIEWTDNSFDEHHFTVLEIDPVSGTVSSFARTEADVRSLSVTLPAGSTRCYLVRAENAANTDQEPVGQQPRLDSNSAAFCFRTP